MEQLRLTETTLADWRQSLNLARLLKDAKQNSGSMLPTEGQVASAEADLEGRQEILQQARNALTVLLGTASRRFARRHAAGRSTRATALPPGLPSDLLLRRRTSCRQNKTCVRPMPTSAPPEPRFPAPGAPQRWATPARLGSLFQAASSLEASPP
jgi:hypothetical protein